MDWKMEGRAVNEAAASLMVATTPGAGKCSQERTLHKSSKICILGFEHVSVHLRRHKVYTGKGLANASRVRSCHKLVQSGGPTIIDGTPVGKEVTLSSAAMDRALSTSTMPCARSTQVLQSARSTVMTRSRRMQHPSVHAEKVW